MGDLVHVPGIALALETMHAKGLRFGVSRPAPPARPAGEQEESVLPFDARASAAAAVLLDTLTSWADLIARARGLFRPLDTWTALPVWLARQVTWLRSDVYGPEAVAKLRGAIRAARQVVDRPPDLVYLGPCGATVVGAGGLHPCGADLYAPAGQHVTEVSCRACLTVHPIGDRREQLLDRVEDMLLPATELARAIDGLGVDVTPERIWKWRQRGRLVARSVDRHGYPTYRVGDVMELVDEAADRSPTLRLRAEAADLKRQLDDAAAATRAVGR